MKRLTFSLLCVAVLAVGSALAQDSDDGKQLALYLKSGDILNGTVKKVDEDGVKLDIGDGVELFINWDYTRGDKHYELRKSAADFSKFASVLKLADFCHQFAMDEEESYVLVTALKLEPKNKEVRDRLNELPKVDGLEIPGEDGAAQPPEDKEDPDNPVVPDQPKPDKDKPLPPPTRGTFKVWIDMKKADDTAKTWMTDHFTEMNYSIGDEKDYEMRVQLDIELTLTKNPEFMGAELYAVYDGELTYKLYKNGENAPFAQHTVKKKDIRRDTRDEARTRTRTELCEDSFTEIHQEFEKLR
ncbi:MAG: hypothetical protein KDB90_03170 [Planctomycetes bacterium]|nr:hypothetical protein [Planctomycetota bacterium]